MTMSDSPPSICLAMIVRNEAPTIARCLASVLAVIDRWLVIDTGSTDGTQEIVRQCLQGVPGELLERPWVNFGHNRSEALVHARPRASYSLIIDADEVLALAPSFDRLALTADSHFVEVKYGDIVYRRKALLRNSLPWRYMGVLHEYPTCEQATTSNLASGLRIHAYHEGARARDPQTYRRDAILLETALLDDPENPRNVFYLAQSYRDSGDLELALRNYRRRIGLGGWHQEVWYCYYQLAVLQERLGRPRAEVAEAYLRAFQCEPQRAEPLYRLARLYAQSADFHLARLFLTAAKAVAPPSNEGLFVERNIYEHAIAVEHADACAQTGEHAEAIAECNGLLRAGRLPAELLERVIQIRKLCLRLRTAARQPDERGGVRLRLCVPFRDSGPAFDDFVESLLLQDDDDFEVVFIDDGSRDDCANRIPMDRPRVSLLRNARPLGKGECVRRFALELCDPDDVVVLLPGNTRFGNRKAIGRIRAGFEHDASCHLLYGQYRTVVGSLGDAEPAADANDFLRRAASLTSQSLVAVRARFLRELDPCTELTSGTGSEGALGGNLRSLMNAVGFERARFVDQVLTSVCADGDIAALQVSLPTTTSSATAAPLQKVSCLMVTHDRLALAKRAIRCYRAQTYPNRELVIVCDGSPRVRSSLELFVSHLGTEDVRFVYPEQAGLRLGQLRNIAMDHAAGEILCQWDDDDCYHPERIRVQVELMLGAGGRACCLTDHLQFLDDDDALVWVDWTLGGKSRKHQLLPGTIVMFKDQRFRYPETGPLAERGEDSSILFQVYDTVGVVAARGVGHLYLYNFHGRNTFDRAHHYRLSSFSRSAADLHKNRDVIRAAMAHYVVSKPYRAIGCDGPAFMLND
jgi:glycosyltransferase involved in cell wall biosynthesis